MKTSVLQRVTGQHIRKGLALLGWTPELLAERAHLSIVEIAKVVDDRAPMYNAVVNCVSVLEAAGICFRCEGTEVAVERDAK